MLESKYGHSLWNLKDEVAENDHNLMCVNSVSILTKLLYNQEKIEQKLAIYSFKQLRREMVAKNFRLSNFFDSIYNASLPQNRNDKYLDKLDKKLMVECYILCSNQNSKLTAFKKDISLFVDLIELSTDAIDALSHADHYYMGRMAKMFNDQFHHEISLDKKLENITLHKYDDRIREQREKRKMKDTILLDFFELSLKDMNSKTINIFEDVFIIQQKSTYADKDHLALLMKKAE
ncbi:2394_t:CDS:2, partial [Racocetra persica]